MNNAAAAPSLNSRRRRRKVVMKLGEKQPLRLEKRAIRMSSPMLTNFLGGSPGSVALRLIVVSFIVGMILVMFGFEPADIVESFTRMAHRLIQFGLTDVRQIGRILATGALVVLPVWLVLRLLDSRRAR
jgi:hypothetical protein